jgi:acyl-coenzyme A synthetase/AMP-(fatty) acid ligase
MTAAAAGFSGPLPPRRFNMAAYVIGRAAQATPDKLALAVITDPEGAEAAETWTYAAIEDAVLRAAAALADAGLKRGDRLLIRLENTSDYALLFFGAIAAGLVPIPASTQLTAPEAAFLLADSGAAALALAAGFPAGDIPAGVRVFSPDDVAAMLRFPDRAGYADTAADDPAYLIYTSGTTSRPKGVLHAHRAAWGRRPMYDGWYGLTSADRMLHAGAFNWTYTLGVGLTDPWACGATSLVYIGEKSPAVWPGLIRRHGATIFAGVPSLYRQILKYAAPTHADLGALRHGLIAGESPPAGLFDDWFAQTGTPLYEAFGMSELSTYISSSPSAPPRAGSIGRPQPGRAVRILPVDNDETEPLPPGTEGLIACHRSDPGLMLGYWNRPDEEREVFRGDWFVGGDMGVMDADGYVSHRGRANDIMKALGYRVSPLEVEAVLLEHPQVAEAAVTEVPVRADVSVIGAFLVPREGAVLDPSDVTAFCSDRLAAYKVPREITLVPGLPRTANGKLVRKALVALRRSSGGEPRG